MEENRALIFKLEDEKDLECLEQLNSVPRKNIFVKTFLKNRDLEGITLSTKKDDENPLKMEELFQLKVNIKSVGVTVFFFLKDDFNKEEAVPEISKLKEINVVDKDTSINKIDALMEIVKKYKPLFVLYDGDEYDNYLTENELKKYEIPSLYVIRKVYKYDSIKNEKFIVENTKEKEHKKSIFANFLKREKELQPQDQNSATKTTVLEANEPIKEENTTETILEPKKPEISKSFNWKVFLIPFQFLAKEKFHYLFLLLASFIICFASAIGVYNCYINNALYIFFFVCSLAGAVLNAFIYYDALEKYRFKLLMLVLNGFVALLGIGIGLGGFYLYFKNLKDIPVWVPQAGTIILIGFGITLCAIAISILVSYLILKFKKPKIKDPK